MEEIPKNNYLKFRPNQLVSVRKLYDLDKPERMKEAIDLLSDWVEKQDHFKIKDYSRGYLERQLIVTKGSVEKSKKQLDKLCTLRTLLPHIFVSADVQSFEKYFPVFTSLVLPEVTEDFTRINIFKIYPNQPLDSDLLTIYMKYIVIMTEYVKAHDYPSGFAIVLDYRDVNFMDLLAIANPVQLNQMMNILIEGYGMRLKGIHLLTTSKLTDALVALIKQVVSKKVANRVHVHKTVDTLYEFIPKEILPSDYNGDAPSLKEIRETFFEALTTKEHMEHMKKMNTACTDESRRPKDLFNETYIGMPGSFRTLIVD